MAETIGLDTQLFIYYLEDNTQYAGRVEKLLKRIQSGKLQAVFSAIGLLEILVGPKKKKRYDLAAEYRQLLTSFPNLAIRGLNENIIEIASDLRASYTIATPDAIHLATAIDSKASSFITNDKKLQNVKEIKVNLI
ncbi:MAG: type II toxin-antitoxin system VapC family toxin [Candidatus Harrisonbacteria bacterium]|nr:type II toxin-antitoxin system VapC family toxin [Candidatus Harrisonbacteria bacterium]